MLFWLIAVFVLLPTLIAFPRPSFQCITHSKPGYINVHIFPSTHLDLGWTSTYQEYYDRCKFSRAFVYVNPNWISNSICGNFAKNRRRWSETSRQDASHSALSIWIVNSFEIENKSSADFIICLSFSWAVSNRNFLVETFTETLSLSLNLNLLLTITFHWSRALSDSQAATFQ